MGTEPSSRPVFSPQPILSPLFARVRRSPLLGALGRAGGDRTRVVTSEHCDPLTEREGMSEGRVGSQGSPLKGEIGNTTISNTVVAQIAGIAALEAEVEGIQMGGGTSAAVGDFLQSVSGSVSGSSGSVDYSRGVSAEVGEEEAAVDLTTTIEYGQSIPRVTEAVRRNIINRVESLTGLRVNEVNITVNDVQVPE
jgi:uncharacterized alkaline shock family protein YloU